MSEQVLFRSDWRPSNRRVLLAGLLGHYAAAYCFCATTMLAGFMSDFQAQGLAMFARTTWGRAFEVFWTAPVVTGLLGLWGGADDQSDAPSHSPCDELGRAQARYDRAADGGDRCHARASSGARRVRDRPS